MITCKYFRIGILSPAVDSLLMMNIAGHRLDWEKEVCNEAICIVHSLYPYSKEQKGAVLTSGFGTNKTLMFLMYTKAFPGIVLLASSVYLSAMQSP